MRWLSTLRLRIRSIARRGRVEDELGEELQYHFDRLVDGFRAGGMSSEEANYAARRAMGATEQRKEDCRDARRVALADQARQDVVYALRGFAKAPGFTAVAVVSLALGIGANTAIFTLWKAMIYASLPAVHAPGELVMLTDPASSGSWTGRWNPRTDGPRAWVTYAEFEQLRDTSTSFSSVMASQSSLNAWQVRVDGGVFEEARCRLVSGAFFDVLGVKPAIGRVFAARDDRARSDVAVISYSYWQRRFGGRPEVLGTTIGIRKVTLTVIGVTPRGFIGETAGQSPDFWLPVTFQPDVIPGQDRLHDTPPSKSMWLHLFARLRPGVSMPQAEAEANAILRAGLESFYGTGLSDEQRREALEQRLVIRPASQGASAVRRDFSYSLTALLAAVGVLLLIACANLANLLIARGAARQPEIALRLSLGASRARLVRQLVTESLLLAAFGGVAAMAFAYVLHQALVRLLAQSDSRFYMPFSLDPIVLAFVVAVTALAALAFGLLPAWQVTRSDPAASLRERSRGATGSPAHMRSGRALVSAQLALSLPLLVGAGLLAQTSYNLQRADLGFATDRLLVVRVDLRDASEDPVRREVLRRQLAEQFRLEPGAVAVSYSNLGLYTGGFSTNTVEVEGYVGVDEHNREVSKDTVGPGYFSTLGIPVRLGREIRDSDSGTGARVCMINEAFARKFFDRRNPIGMRITTVDDDNSRVDCSVVGVAGDAHTSSLRDAVEPQFFVAAEQPPSAPASPTYLIRTSGSSAAVLSAARRIVQRVDPGLTIITARSFDQQLSPVTAQERTTAQLVVAFGGIALALAAIGLYGVLSYGIARRTAEIAIRIALGAPARRVVAMVLRETAGLVLAGLMVGAALAVAASRLIGSQLYGVAPQDPITVAAAVGVLLAVSLAASYLPARRASRLDPMQALRQ